MQSKGDYRYHCYCIAGLGMNTRFDQPVWTSLSGVVKSAAYQINGHGGGLSRRSMRRRGTVRPPDASDRSG